MHAVGDLDIADVQGVFSFNPPCREDSGGAIYLEFVFGVVKYLDPRLISRESYWVGDTNIQVGKWPLWSGMGSSRMGLCEYFFDQVIHCSHGARWVYTLYHLPLNGISMAARRANSFASLLLHNATHSYTRTDNRAVAC